VGLLLQYLLTLAQETPAVKSHGKSKAAVKSGVKGKAKSRTAGKA
jgi:hypothetical protein